jgi:antibiotic biosynthesis monooxygenase (ABM) superfamily enzyme
MSEPEDTDGADGAITVLVARRVVPGKEIEFEKWASELTRAASSFDGFLGAGLLQPGHVGELWHVVYRFASADELARWEESKTRLDLLAHGEEVMSTSHERRITGLETWFEVPGRTAPAPPRWKMFVVTSVVIFVLQLMLNLVLRQFASPIALVPRVALISFTVSALALLLERWLYAPRRSP